MVITEVRKAMVSGDGEAEGKDAQEGLSAGPSRGGGR